MCPKKPPSQCLAVFPPKKSSAMEVSLCATNRNKRLVGKDAETQG